MHSYVLFFIETVRNSFPTAVEIYTNGSRYKFYLILKAVFPHAHAYYNSEHIITKIQDRYYDITGEVTRSNHLSVNKYYSHDKLNNIDDMS